MTSVIKMKASVDNTNLPILNEDGTISNYYIGRFKSALLSVGYELPQAKETALNAFIDDGLSKGWIDYVDYILPFIGDSDHPKAAFAPLVDRLSNYVIPVPEDTDSHILNALHFNGSDVVGFGSPINKNYPPTTIQIPLQYTRYKGISILTRVSTDMVSQGSCIGRFAKGEVVMLALRNSGDSIQLYSRSSEEASSSTKEQLDMNTYGTVDALTSIYIDKVDSSKKRNIFVKRVGMQNLSLHLYHRAYDKYGPDDISSVEDMDFKIASMITGNANFVFVGNLPYWMAVDPYIPQQGIEDLLNAVAALCTDLGRDPE